MRIKKKIKKTSPIESQCAVLQRLLWHKTPVTSLQSFTVTSHLQERPQPFSLLTQLKSAQADITSSHAAAEPAADSCRDIRLGPETVDPMWNTYTHRSFV